MFEGSMLTQIAISQVVLAGLLWLLLVVVKDGFRRNEEIARQIEVRIKGLELRLEPDFGFGDEDEEEELEEEECEPWS